MQATHARKTFPCFDEPAMKAVFNVTIIHDRSTTALSNGRDIGPSTRCTTVLSGTQRSWARETAPPWAQTGHAALSSQGFSVCHNGLCHRL